jgi:hypothetical protein
VFGDLRFTVADMDGKRVARVKVERSKPLAATLPAAEPAEKHDDPGTLQRKSVKPAVSQS